MDVFQAVIQGIIQGITEFFPISSSGHLISIRYLFGWEMAGSMSFDIALHFGTLLAIVIFFFKDWVSLIKNGFSFITKESKKFSFKNLTKEGKIFWYIVVATIPGALAGFLLDDFLEEAVRNNILLIAGAFAVMGVILYIADKKSKSTVEFEKITLKQSIFIGIAQMFAIIPGFSRSGTTMSMARFLKIDRKSAAKFSFLLGTPIMAGAMLAHIFDFSLAMINLPFIIGVLTSFIVGILCIKLLMSMISKMGFGVFAIYRIALALLLVVVYFIRL